MQCHHQTPVRSCFVKVVVCKHLYCSIAFYIHMQLHMQLSSIRAPPLRGGGGMFAAQYFECVAVLYI